jgi:hypothetical protein
VELAVELGFNRRALVAEKLIGGDEELALQAALVGEQFVEQGGGPVSADGGALRLRFARA